MRDDRAADVVELVRAAVAAAGVWFLAVFAAATGKYETRLWACATAGALLLLGFVCMPLTTILLDVVAPRLLDHHFAHVGDPFRAPRLPFLREFAATPADLVDPAAVEALAADAAARGAIVAHVERACATIARRAAANSMASALRRGTFSATFLPLPATPSNTIPNFPDPSRFVRVNSPTR